MNNIEKRIILKIKNIIFKNIKNNSHYFFLFGSRVDWTAKERSDYDIWFIWKKKLDTLIKSNIDDEFEKIPALIDLVDFSTVSDGFKKVAMKDIIWLNK